jgi:hypothetical protein
MALDDPNELAKVSTRPVKVNDVGAVSEGQQVIGPRRENQVPKARTRPAQRPVAIFFLVLRFAATGLRRWTCGNKRPSDLAEIVAVESQDDAIPGLVEMCPLVKSNGIARARRVAAARRPRGFGGASGVTYNCLSRLRGRRAIFQCSSHDELPKLIKESQAAPI